MGIEHSALTSIHRFAYVSATDPGAVGAFKGWVDTSSSPFTFKIRNSADTGWDLISADVGGTNVGATGQTVYKQKTGQNLEFRKVGAGSTGTVTVGLSSDTITIDVNQAGLDVNTIGGTMAYSRLQMNTGYLLGRNSPSSGNAELIQIGVGAGLEFSGTTIINTNRKDRFYADVVYNNNATLATVLELNWSVSAGSEFFISGYIPVTSAVKGPKFAFGGTATVAGFLCDWEAKKANTAGAAVDTTRTTAPSTSVSFTLLDGQTGYIKVSGWVQFSTAGTFRLQAAQSTADASNTTLQKGGWFNLTRVV